MVGRCWWIVIVVLLVGADSRSQMRIDSMRISLGGIPVVVTDIHPPDPQLSHNEVDGFAYSTRSPATISVQDDSVAMLDSMPDAFHGQTGFWRISFVVDSAARMIYHFVYRWDAHTAPFELRGADWWEQISMDSIELRRFGPDYRAYMSGRQLHERHLEYFGSYMQQIGVATWTGTSFQTRDTAFSDTSFIEILLYGNVPLEVKAPKLVGSMTLVPNPASESVTIVGADPTSDVEIVDILGRTMLQTYTPASDGALRLDISHLLPGCYRVRAGAESRELIVRR